jgi:hypothetical protein
MNPFEVYKKYIAVKSHFSSNYDYFKYRGKMKISHDTFLKRKDKFFFERLSKKYKEDEIEDIFFSNFVVDDNFWIGQANILENYESWKTKIRSLSYNIKNDIDTISNYCLENNIKFIHLFKVGSYYPDILNLYNQKQISIEFMAICDYIFNFMTYWRKHYDNDMILEHQIKKIHKYKPFLLNKIDKEKIKELIKKRIDKLIKNNIIEIV